MAIWAIAGRRDAVQRTPLLESSTSESVGLESPVQETCCKWWLIEITLDRELTPIVGAGVSRAGGFCGGSGDA